ncbi:MAG TPA: hypothetical protein VFV33_17695, partial [Gemmatimonadaceae bacterium]|nr:hypothetical protein [Gemmatimonadaceae bacterium]
TPPAPPLANGSVRSVAGTLTIGVVTPAGVQYVARDEPWRASAEARDGALAIANAGTSTAPGALRGVSSLLAEEPDGSFGAAAAPPVLALLATHDLARGRPNDAFASSFRTNGHEYTVAMLWGEGGGPVQRMIFFEDGKAVHTARYEWERRGGVWEVQEVVTSTWRDGRPTGVIVSRVTDSRAVASRAAAAPDPIADASGAIIDALAFVADRFLVPTAAGAQASGTRKYYFSECATQWLGVSGAGLTLAFALAPASGPIEKLKVAGYAHALLVAYATLAKCVGDQRRLEAQQQETQRVAGDILTINDEPLTWDDMPEEVRNAVRAMAALCDREYFDIVCGEFAVAY